MWDADPFLCQTRLQKKKVFLLGFVVGGRRNASLACQLASALPQKIFFFVLPFTGQSLQRRRMRGPQQTTREPCRTYLSLELLGAVWHTKNRGRLATLGGPAHSFSV